MLQKRISLNKAVNDLSGDTSRLMFTWTIAHLDQYGRIHGDPSVLKSLVFPRRADVTEEDVQTYIREWVERGLVVWYEASGERWLQFPAFKRNQPGMRADREPESGIPAPEDGKHVDGSVPASIRQTSGSVPEDSPPNGIQCKGKERKSEVAPPQTEDDDAHSSPDYPKINQVHIDLATQLLDYIKDNDPKAFNGKSEATIKKWADSFRLLMDKDGREEEEIRDVLHFATHDQFWKVNILSGQKFRDKYTALKLKRDATGASNDEESLMDKW